MPDYRPITGATHQPPYRPSLQPLDDPMDRLAFDQLHKMWVNTPRRARTYICSRGETHRTYWRTHWRQGRQDWVACIHEVDEPRGESSTQSTTHEGA